MLNDIGHHHLGLPKEVPKNHTYHLWIPQVVDFPLGTTRNHLQQIKDYAYSKLVQTWLGRLGS